MKKPIALYGGSFNPPHVVHAMVCLYLLQTGCRQVWMLPTFRHAFGKALAPWEDRLEMCRKATSPLGERVQVCEVEAENPEVSYTIDTVRKLQARFPEERFVWVVGSDILGELDRWKDVEELLQRIELRVLYRGGYPTGKQEVSFPALSSTQIRQQLEEGAPVEGWLSQEVIEYIRIKGLYQGGQH